MERRTRDPRGGPSSPSGKSPKRSLATFLAVCLGYLLGIAPREAAACRVHGRYQVVPAWGGSDEVIVGRRLGWNGRRLLIGVRAEAPFHVKDRDEAVRIRRLIVFVVGGVEVGHGVSFRQLLRNTASTSAVTWATSPTATSILWSRLPSNASSSENAGSSTPCMRGGHVFERDTFGRLADHGGANLVDDVLQRCTVGRAA